VLGDGRGGRGEFGGGVRCGRGGPGAGIEADAAVAEEVAEGEEFGGVNGVADVGLLLVEEGFHGGPGFVVFVHDERGRVAEFAHVVQRGEDVLFGFFFAAGGHFGEGATFLFGEVFKQLLLHVAEFAVVVLDYFGWQVVEHFFFEATQ